MQNDSTHLASGEINAASEVAAHQPRDEESHGLQRAYVEAARSGSARPPVNVGGLERLVSLSLGAACCLAGLSRGRLPGLLMTLGGGALVYRGWTGHCHAYAALGLNSAAHADGNVIPAQQGQRAEKAVVVHRPPEALYAFCRDVENLRELLPHVKEVSAESRTRSHWVAEGPFGGEYHWDAEIFNERERELIAWRSLPGGDVDTAGSIRFHELSHDRGTEVRLEVKYNPPGGQLGAIVAFLGGRGLQHEIAEGLRNLKRRFEAGEIPRVG